ncbi:MAG TPA: glycosyltransferase family 4 protein [Chthoniobacterales bacterium]|nr:glycosyltransferase family 4 protein [Chthoniobacterales bacterium]
MDKIEQPLRILIVLNLPWDVRFGATRVWMELAEQWRTRGHTVEKFSLNEAFPRGAASRIASVFRQPLFAFRAAAFVRKNRDRFDVIDALIGALPFSKRRLNFQGLLVARSVGLPQLYDQFERSVARRWPHLPRGRLGGRILRAFVRREGLRMASRSIAQADLLNLPNEEEATYLRREIGSTQPLIVQPYGLTTAQGAALLQAASAPAVRLGKKKICFIGMWGARKGSHDWSEIIRRVRERVPDAEFRFLGTMVNAEAMRRDLGGLASTGVEFIPEYQPDELPALLADCAVGAFPSYVEGFGFAVIEQLAAGIPTVAYDVAGPRHILGGQFAELLVPAGDLVAFAAALVGVLQLGEEAYQLLSTRSVQTAGRFSWPVIADETLVSYQGALAQTRR